MNDILLTHAQRISDKQQIMRGSKNLHHQNSKSYYLQKQRQRQKKQNTIINNLKRANKTFNGLDLKKFFMSSTIEIMNSYLDENSKFTINDRKKLQHTKTTQESQKSQKSQQSLQSKFNKRGFRSQNVKTVYIFEQYKQKQLEFDKFDKPQDQVQGLGLQQNNNFYQNYINLFVNFFNQKSQFIDSNSIKSIIRPNNRFVLIDLLKALLQFARTDIKYFIKETVFHQIKTETVQKIIMFRNNTEKFFHNRQNSKNSKDVQTKQIEVLTSYSPFNTEQQSPQRKQQRRVQTQPQINSSQNQNLQQRNQLSRISPSPTKNFRTKNSATNFLKHHSTELTKIKSDEVEQLNNRYLHANFIDANIKQILYEKNNAFVSQINLQKLQSKANSLFIELNRLNFTNNQIITEYYEDNLGNKNKFNYDSRGLYSQVEIQMKKSQLTIQIQKFKTKLRPNLASNSIELTQYALEYLKYKNKCEELASLQKQKQSDKIISNWIPLKLSFTQSIIEPLKIQIQQINPITSEIMSYHWKKYKKQFSICQFFKQRVKVEYERIQIANKKTIQQEIFKKKKFRKSLFLQNRKKINQFLQSNNVIFTKKQSIFPVLKGIQQNYIKNMNTYVAQPTQNYIIQSNYLKSKQIYVERQQQRVILSSSSCKNAIHSFETGQKVKRFDSTKKSLSIKQKSERKFSDTEKILEKLPEKQKQRVQLLTKLSVKYDMPVSMSNRQKQSQKYEKKNLISMSKIIDLKSELLRQTNLKKVENFSPSQIKVSIQNLI